MNGSYFENKAATLHEKIHAQSPDTDEETVLKRLLSTELSEEDRFAILRSMAVVEILSDYLSISPDRVILHLLDIVYPELSEDTIKNRFEMVLALMDETYDESQLLQFFEDRLREGDDVDKLTVFVTQVLSKVTTDTAEYEALIKRAEESVKFLNKHETETYKEAEQVRKRAEVDFALVTYKKHEKKILAGEVSRENVYKLIVVGIKHMHSADMSGDADEEIMRRIHFMVLDYEARKQKQD